MVYNPRHIKLLTDEQLKHLKEKYSIKQSRGNLYVKLNSRNHTVMHDANESFSLRCQNRRVTINAQAISMWHKNFKQYNLLDVQHAMNLLATERIEPTKQKVSDKLETL